MSNSLSIAPAGPDASGPDGRSPSKRQPGRQPAPAAEPDTAPTANPELRLVIQQVGDTGDFVYTVIDRISGQVVHQTPREEVAHMGERAGYAAGALIKTRA
jgi:flagellar protein FlaG